MARYRTTVHATRDADDVFAYMAAFEHSAEWDPGVAEAERLTDGPVGPDTRFRVVTLVAGRKIPLEYRVTAFGPGRRVVVTAESSSLRSVDEITVDADGDGSSMTYDADLSLRGVFVLLTPLLAVAFHRIGDRARGGLRRELNR
jgi:hypothetical protein